MKATLSSLPDGRGRTIMGSTRATGRQPEAAVHLQTNYYWNRPISVAHIFNYGLASFP